MVTVVLVIFRLYKNKTRQLRRVMNKIFRPVAKLFGIPIRFNMDSNRLNTDLQQRFPFTSLDDSPGTLGGSPLGGRQMPSEAPLVDTRSYETYSSQGFELNPDLSHLKTIIDRSTGELAHIDINQAGDYSRVKSSYDARQQSRLRKFELLTTSSKLLWNPKGGKSQHRTCKCNKVRIDNEVRIFSTENNSHYGGLAQCGAVWTCPVCATKINERKGQEMRQAFIEAIARGYNVELISQTMPHYIDQSLSKNIDKLSKARQGFWRSYTAKKWRNMGYLGRIDAFEITHGENGWHPHVHTVVFSKGDNTHIHKSLRKEWINQLVKYGVAVHGQLGIHRSMDIRDGSKAGEYICKFGTDGDAKLTHHGKPINWDMADEMTRSHTKHGRGQSLTPFDFLRLINSSDTNDDDKKYYSTLFRQYARTMKGRSQLRWSKGLRDIFGLGEELSDQDIVEQQEKDAICKAVITKHEWQSILDKDGKQNSRSILLQLAERHTLGTGEQDALARYIYTCANLQIPFSEYVIQFNERVSKTNTLLEINKEYINERT